jgi:hypothetical protein
VYETYVGDNGNKPSCPCLLRVIPTPGSTSTPKQLPLFMELEHSDDIPSSIFVAMVMCLTGSTAPLLSEGTTGYSCNPVKALESNLWTTKDQHFALCASRVPQFHYQMKALMVTHVTQSKHWNQTHGQRRTSIFLEKMRHAPGSTLFMK